MNSFELIDIPKITDPRGNISVVEKNTIPFEIKRVYYLYDIPSGTYRGGHAHIKQFAILIALSGSFEVLLDTGKMKEIITLNKPNKGLLIKNGVWRELQNFSSGSVCLVLASEIFDENDYVRDYNTFLKLLKHNHLSSKP